MIKRGDRVTFREGRATITGVVSDIEDHMAWIVADPVPASIKVAAVDDLKPLSPARVAELEGLK